MWPPVIYEQTVTYTHFAECVYYFIFLASIHTDRKIISGHELMAFISRIKNIWSIILVFLVQSNNRCGHRPHRETKRRHDPLDSIP